MIENKSDESAYLFQRFKYQHLIKNHPAILCKAFCRNSASINRICFASLFNTNTEIKTKTQKSLFSFVCRIIFMYLTNLCYNVDWKMCLKLVLLLILVEKSSCIVDCDSSSGVYKSVLEGPWFFTIPNRQPIEFVKFVVNRTMQYSQCYYNFVNFRTERELSHSVRESVESTHKFFGQIYYCNENCMNKIYTIYVWYQYRSITSRLLRSEWNERKQQFAWSDWSSWIYLNKDQHFHKKCDKLYWTSWAMSTSCKRSFKSSYTRSCVDCDEDSVQSRYCQGLSTKQTQCHHFVSDWSEPGPCKIIGCNKTGEHVRRRKCLYGDGTNETSNFQLCLNQISVKSEKCHSTQQKDECQVHWSGWDEIEPCLVYGCNTTGERVRRRKCLYKDETEAYDIQLCSNQSTTMRELCVNTTYSEKCQQSLANNTTNNVGIFVGIGTTVVLLAVVCIAFAISKHYRNKVEQLPSNYVMYQNSSVFESAANGKSEAIQAANPKKQVIPSVYEMEQTLEQVPEASYCTIQDSKKAADQNNFYSSISKPTEMPENDYSTLCHK